MGRRFYYSGDSSTPVYITHGRSRRHYGPFRFLFDCFMTLITGGLWFIWIFIREMRRNRW